MLSSLTALTSSIGASAVAVNPALGLGMGAFSEFLGSTIEFARNRSINRQIRNINNETLMFNGLSCAMESLNNRWCEVNEARKVLEFKFELEHSEEISPDLLAGVELFDRKIPSFLGWLSRVRSGTPPSTDADAIRFSVVFEREKIVRTREASGIGILNSTGVLYNSAPVSRRLSILKTLIERLSGLSCSSGGMGESSGVPNPLYEIYTASTIPYVLLGLPQDKIPPSQNGFNPFWALVLLIVSVNTETSC